VSCCLQRSVAQVIANRIDGRQDAPEPEDESVVVVAEGEEGEEHEGEEPEGGEPLGREPLVGKPSIGIVPSISKPRSIFRGPSSQIPPSHPQLPPEIPPFHPQIPPVPPQIPPVPPQIPPFPPKVPPFSEAKVSQASRNELGNRISQSGVGGEVGDVGDGGRDGGKGHTIHSENITHIDFNRPGAKSKVHEMSNKAGRGSAKGKKQGPTRRAGSAKGTGMRHYKDSHGEKCNKVTYSSNSLEGSSLFPSNANTCITTHPTYNKHNAGSSTSTFLHDEVRNRVNRGGAL
jgi:hypothetical protein